MRRLRRPTVSKAASAASWEAETLKFGNTETLKHGNTETRKHGNTEMLENLEIHDFGREASIINRSLQLGDFVDIVKCFE